MALVIDWGSGGEKAERFFLSQPRGAVITTSSHSMVVFVSVVMYTLGLEPAEAFVSMEVALVEYLSSTRGAARVRLATWSSMAL